MHTVETDGKNTIEEMAEAAKARGYQYMAITDHSKNLAFANGLDDTRAVAHIQRIRDAGKKIDGITIFAGIEVDILADGDLDLSDDVLAQMDIVIASVHSRLQSGTGQDDRPPAAKPSRIPTLRSSAIPPAASSCAATPTPSTWTPSSPPPPNTKSRWN